MKKYIAKVIDNNDENKGGRVQVYIEELHHDISSDLYPWVRQDREFTSFIPEVDDLVWVYFQDEVFFRQSTGFYCNKVTLKEKHEHDETIGSITGEYPNIKYIKLKNGCSIAMNSDDPEITITHPSAEIFIDVDGNIIVTDATGNEIIMDTNGVEVKIASGKKAKLTGTPGTPNGQGGFCALPGGACLFTGAIITTDEIIG